MRNLHCLLFQMLICPLSGHRGVSRYQAPGDGQSPGETRKGDTTYWRLWGNLFVFPIRDCRVTIRLTQFNIRRFPRCWFARKRRIVAPLVTARYAETRNGIDLFPLPIDGVALQVLSNVKKKNKSRTNPGVQLAWPVNVTNYRFGGMVFIPHK